MVLLISKVFFGILFPGFSLREHQKSESILVAFSFKVKQRLALSGNEHLYSASNHKNDVNVLGTQSDLQWKGSNF